MDPQKLIDAAKDNVRFATQQSPHTLWKDINRFLRYIMLGRFGVTIFLIGWLVLITVLILREKPNEQTDEQLYAQPYVQTYVPQQNSQAHAKYFNLHRVWFGEQSIIMIIFKIWYYALIVWMMTPLMRELVVFAKLRMSV